MNLKIGGRGGLNEESLKRIRAGASKFLKEKWSCSKYRAKLSILASERIKKTHKQGKFKYATFKGKLHSIETKAKMSASSKGLGKGANNSQFGTIWITKNSENKKIKKESLNDWITQGWIKGRKL